MRTSFIAKLAAWHRLWTELKHARVQLAQAEGCDRAEAIRADVQRLQDACDQALGELQAVAQDCLATQRPYTDLTQVVQPPDLGLGTEAEGFLLLRANRSWVQGLEDRQLDRRG